MTADGVNGVIEVSGLSRRFGRSLALDDVNLEVPRGLVFGLVGENGAGKTTLIKHLLGLYRAQAGTVRVLGGDPVTQPVEILARVGYLSEDRDLPDWMRIGELLNYLRAFYPTWDAALADRLRNDFDLDPRARIKSLSQGQRARVGLVGPWRTGRTCWSWTSRPRASTRSFAATSWPRSSGRSPTRAARSSSRRTCSTRSSAWPIPSR